MSKLTEQEKNDRIVRAINQGTLDLKTKTSENFGDVFDNFVREKAYDTVKLLLDNGLDPYIVSTTHCLSSALRSSINMIERNGDCLMLKIFLDRGVRLDIVQKTSNGDVVPIVDLLAKYYRHSTTTGRDIKPILIQIIESGANLHPNASITWSALPGVINLNVDPYNMVLTHLDTDMLRLMLKHDNQIDKINWNGIYNTFMNQITRDTNFGIVRIFLDVIEEYCPDKDVFEEILRRVLLKVSYRTCCEPARYIIQRLGINNTQKTLNKALNEAFRNGSNEMIRFLLSKGAKLYKNCGMWNYLEFEAEYTTREAIYERIKLFLSCGGDINATFHSRTIFERFLMLHPESNMVNYVLDNGGNSRSLEHLLRVQHLFHTLSVTNVKLLIHYGCGQLRYVPSEIKLPKVVSLNRMCLNVLYDFKDELIRIGFAPLLFAWPYDLDTDEYKFYDNEKDGIECILPILPPECPKLNKYRSYYMIVKVTEQERMTELSEREEDYNRISRAIKQGTLDLNYETHPEIGTMFADFVYHKSHDIVKLLLKSGIDPCIPTAKRIKSAFWQLIDNINSPDDVEILEMFLEHGAEINKTLTHTYCKVIPITQLVDKYYSLGPTPTRRSVSLLLTKIIKSGLNLHPENEPFSYDPLHRVIRMFDANLLRIMFKYDKYLDKIDWLSMCQTLVNDALGLDRTDLYIEILNIIEEYYTGDNFDNILHEMLIHTHHNHKFVKYILQKLGIRIEQDAVDEALCNAFQCGSNKVIRLLLEKGADPNAPHKYNKQNGLVKYLNRLGANDYKEFSNVVDERIGLFVDYGGNVNARIGNHHHFGCLQTVIHLMSYINMSSDIIKYVLDKGGDARLFQENINKGFIGVSNTNLKLMLHYGCGQLDYDPISVKLPPVVSLYRMCLNVLYDDIDELIRIGFPPLLFKWPYDLDTDGYKFYDNEKDGIEW